MAIGRLQAWWARNPGLSAVAAAVLVAIVVWLNSARGIADVQIRWVATIAAVVAGLALIGAAVNARPAGVLIDNRNRVSLSKFQATAWTVLVLTSLITAASLNPAAGTEALENIQIPGEILLAMGISATSLVATPMLLSRKSDELPAANALARTAEKLNLSPSDLQSVGMVFGRSSPELASWADMFRGDETGNAGDADLSKVQQFLITLLLIGIYASSVWYQFGKSSPKLLPPIPPNFLWLMGISHASYLIYKAAPHSASASAPGTGDPAFEAVG
jgi:hypothetical protein